MIALIIKSYLAILIAVGLGAALLLTAGVFMIIRYFSNKSLVDSHTGRAAMTLIHSQSADQVAASLDGIAGENMMATRLDLARAYIETSQFHAAKQLLDTVRQEGTLAHIGDADKLLATISDQLFLERVKKNAK